MIKEYIAVQTVYAHGGEEVAKEGITLTDFAGPVLAIIIIIIAVAIARHLRK